MTASVQELSDRIDKCLDRLRSCQLVIERKWAEKAKSHAAAMSSTQRQAESFLDDPDPAVRILAVEALTIHWTIDSRLIDRLCEMIVHDENLGVKKLSLKVIEYSCGTADRDTVLVKLSKAVLNSEYDSQMRCACFDCLIGIIERTEPQLLSTAAYRRPVTSLAAIDWRLLSRFAP